MGIRTDLLVTEEISESLDLRATPFEFERAKRVEAALSILEGKCFELVIRGGCRKRNKPVTKADGHSGETDCFL